MIRNNLYMIPYTRHEDTQNQNKHSSMTQILVLCHHNKFGFYYSAISLVKKTFDVLVVSNISQYNITYVQIN